MGAMCRQSSLTAVDARQIDNVFTRPSLSQRSLAPVMGASSSDLDIGGRVTDRRCWAMSGCFVNNGVTS